MDIVTIYQDGLYYGIKKEDDLPTWDWLQNLPPLKERYEPISAKTANSGNKTLSRKITQ